MTTLVESIQAVLDPLVSGHAWYQVNTAQPQVLPYIVFGRIPSPAHVTLQGPSQLQNTRLQIDAYSRSVQELIALGDSIETAMVSAGFTNVPLSSRDLYEPDTKLYRTCYEYSVWSAN